MRSQHDEGAHAPLKDRVTRRRSARVPGERPDAPLASSTRLQTGRTLRDSGPIQRLERLERLERTRRGAGHRTTAAAPHRLISTVLTSRASTSARHGATTRRPMRRQQRHAAHKQYRWRGMPLRYSAIALGSCLLFLAGILCLPLWYGASSPLRGLLTLLCSFGGLAVLVLATMPIKLPRRWYRRLMQWRHLSAIFSGIMAAASLVVFVAAASLIFSGLLSNSFLSDVISFSYVNARLVLTGHNPYVSDASFVPALQRFPNAIETPLRRGAFGSGYDYPALNHINDVEHRYLTDPGQMHGEFDQNTLHSYPALSFLIYVPLIWAGVDNILLLHMVVFWALFAWLVWLTPPGWRHWGALAAGAALPILLYSLMLDTEVICVAFLLTAWHYRNRNWWASAILLGLGCAFKQYAWFFVPFFLLDAWLEQGRWAAPFAEDFSIRARGWRHVGRTTLAALISGGWGAVSTRTGVMLAAFLAPNLPFMLLSPSAWFHSLWLPMTEPLFPTGMGVIALFTGHALPWLPPYIFTVMEALALLATLWVFIRWRPKLRESALLLALIPLLFAFRSLPNYFAVAPWLALYAANMVYARQLAGRPAQRSPLSWEHLRATLHLDRLLERMKVSLLIRLAAR
ncbi:MAG: hypothetical protein ABI068_14385 [Ktedonobacterales bacterium]